MYQTTLFCFYDYTYKTNYKLQNWLLYPLKNSEIEFWIQYLELENDFLSLCSECCFTGYENAFPGRGLFGSIDIFMSSSGSCSEEACWNTEAGGGQLLTPDFKTEGERTTAWRHI